MTNKNLRFVLVVIIVFLFSCGDNYTPEQQSYVDELEQYRAEYDNYMENDPNSPFNNKGKVDFHSLNYFEPNFDFIFKSPLTEYAQKETVTVFGTKGEERKAVRWGFLGINYEHETQRLNVYQSATADSQVYYSVWFTDETTNDETYGVGRYLHFDLQEDSNYVYTIDFNRAFNPYCAYSKEYSCAIPRKEDRLNIAIKAGEKKFHD